MYLYVLFFDLRIQTNAYINSGHLSAISKISIPWESHSCLAFSAVDMNILLIGTISGNVFLWDISKSGKSKRCIVNTGGVSVTSLACCRDYLVIGDRNGLVHLADTRSWEEVGLF